MDKSRHARSPFPYQRLVPSQGIVPAADKETTHPLLFVSSNFLYCLFVLS
eukprot:COSAG06_NODE_250_length_19080_cov_6.483029_11_plen_50_part_00